MERTRTLAEIAVAAWREHTEAEAERARAASLTRQEREAAQVRYEIGQIRRLLLETFPATLHESDLEQAQVVVGGGWRSNPSVSLELDGFIFALGRRDVTLLASVPERRGYWIGFNTGVERDALIALGRLKKGVAA